ncbi:MAG: hypothetical protein KGL77_02360 [Actinomycetales bacterium]|nr:hypothetical protein [Actinomycetales bacterium]
MGFTPVSLVRNSKSFVRTGLQGVASFLGAFLGWLGFGKHFYLPSNSLWSDPKIDIVVFTQPWHLLISTESFRAIALATFGSILAQLIISKRSVARRWLGFTAAICAAVGGWLGAFCILLQFGYWYLAGYTNAQPGTQVNLLFVALFAVWLTSLLIALGLNSRVTRGLN